MRPCFVVFVEMYKKAISKVSVVSDRQVKERKLELVSRKC
jgi:hypothetical protein